MSDAVNEYLKLYEKDTKELVEIAYYSLKTQYEDEEKFLEPIMELLKKNKVPADV